MTLPLMGPVLRMVARIISIIIFLFTIIAAFGGRCNPQYFALPSVFTLALPYLAIATILIGIAWLLGRRLIMGALAAGTIFLCIGPISTAIPLHSSSKPTPGATTFTLLTFNILHGDDYRDHDYEGNRSFEYVLDSGADVVCLQELREFIPAEIPHYSKALADSLRKVYPYQAGDKLSDLKVLSKYPVEILDLPAYPRPPHQWVATRAEFFRLKIKGKSLTLVNMHLNSYSLTPEEREVVTDIKSISTAKESLSEMKGSIRKKLSESFKKRAENVTLLREAINSVKGNLIMAGDFNDVPESYAYRLLRGDDLKDAYVETNFGPTFTYNAHLFYFHLDQIFYRGNLKALSVKRGRINSSDHYPLIAEFEFTSSATE